MLRSPDLMPGPAFARLYRLPVVWLRVEVAAGRLPGLIVDGEALVNKGAVERALAERAAQVTGSRKGRTRR